MIDPPNLFEPEPTPDHVGVLIAFGAILGLVLAAAIVAAPPKPRLVLFLPDHPVFRHCFCGYPSKDLKDLEGHLRELHPQLPEESRQDILFPRSSEGSE